MDANLQKQIDASRDLHLPLPVDEQETAEIRLQRKEVLASRQLDDMDSLDPWQAITKFVQLKLSSTHKRSGRYSLRMENPTNLKTWPTGRAHGRIYAEPAALRIFPGEDWRDFNRISAWVYPHVPGMKSINLRLQLHNDGIIKVPDRYARLGAHNVNLKPDCWNLVALEIPSVPRDRVTGISFVYDMCGHEPEAADHCVWYIDELRLEKVVCDVDEGFRPGLGRIAFSGSGYAPEQEKQAITASLADPSFAIVRDEDEKCLYRGQARPVSGPDGSLWLFDFSQLTQPGTYRLIAGSMQSRSFPIADDVWLPSIWKGLNFYFSQRCGYEVIGKHRACHADLLLQHQGRAIVANGGWHDAGDLAQSLNNTADATAALLELSAKPELNRQLRERVLEEARWGLNYVLKMRFGDGYRASYSSVSIWTDGIIGTDDDIVSHPDDNPYTNFLCAYVLALAARILAERDADLSRYCKKTAESDYAFAQDKWQAGQAVPKTGRHPAPEVQLASIQALAAACLYERTENQDYLNDAAEAGELLVSCQQCELTEWDEPMHGFFYQDANHRLLWHHNHHSQSHLPILALQALLDFLPDLPQRSSYRQALNRFGDYLCVLSRHTQPYQMIPAGIYHEDEAIDYPKEALGGHPFVVTPPDDLPEQYRRQVCQGIFLGQGWYVRFFPVWFSFRGNVNVQLSSALAAAIVGRCCGRPELTGLASRQLEWIVGKNPFAQSLLYGEGYDYGQQYAVQPGQTVGQLPVGIQTRGEADRPYWPQVNTATYKEVWIASINKWMWTLAHLKSKTGGSKDK